jgi:hypothetical protein
MKNRLKLILDRGEVEVVLWVSLSQDWATLPPLGCFKVGL